jgi:uncharacterized protein (DUF58 family)
MNPIPLLTNAVNDLWFWTYGLVAGWGLMFTMVVAAVIFLIARQIRVERKLKELENRLVHAERDYNLSVNKWQARH